MKSALDIFLIGIGSGNLNHLTLEAIQAMNGVDLILIPDKGEDKRVLAEIRQEILHTHSQTQSVTFAMPMRDESIQPYPLRVQKWHESIAQKWEEAVAEHNARSIALLVWGDPSLYDSTLRIAQYLKNYAANITVIPGITSIQALTAAHKIPLNDINEPVMITTGRQLRESDLPKAVRRFVVMLDGELSFQQLNPLEWDIYWTAYAGMEEEISVSGALADVAGEIIKTREAVRAAQGWVMDIYLLARKDEAHGD